MVISAVAKSAPSAQGFVIFGSLKLRCALGKSGRTASKREGDGATPAGRWRLLRVYYRPDRLMRPRTRLPVVALRPSDGWCDAIGDRNYNRPVRLPYPASHERLWRNDGLYDLIVVLDYNIAPRRQMLGSAIFMHVARQGYKPTLGCVALSRPDLLRLLASCGPQTAIDVSLANQRGRRGLR